VVLIIDIQMILNQIFNILEYFVPGFIFITFFNKLTSRNGDKSYQVIWFIIMSFLIKQFFIVLHGYIFISRSFSLGERVLICSFGALLLSIACVYISERKWFNRFMIFINNKSVHSDIWHDIIDYDNGTALRIVCDKENIIYSGTLDCHEEKGNDSWFVLKDYVIEYIDGKSVDSRKISSNTKIAVNLKSVDRIELYYTNNEKKSLLKRLLQIISQIKIYKVLTK
jgi:hypothetical protein